MMSTLEWHQDGIGWTASACIGDEGIPFKFCITVDGEGLFAVKHSDGEVLDQVDRDRTFERMVDAKDWCRDKNSLLGSIHFLNTHRVAITKTFPAVAGYYWMRRGERYAWQIVNVDWLPHAFKTQPSPRQLHVFSVVIDPEDVGESQSQFCKDHPHAEWRGPLREPRKRGGE